MTRAAPERSGATVREMYREQVRWAAEEGADLIIAETNDYLGEAVIALEVIQEFELPSIVTFASTSEQTIDGHELDDACRRLADQGADVVGLNCSRGPETMLPLLERVGPPSTATSPRSRSRTARRPRSRRSSRCGTPAARAASRSALDPFLCTRFEMADFAAAARDLGVGFIGICCGGAPHHVRSMAERLGRTVPASRYSPDMAQHPVLGEHVREHAAKASSNWKD